MCLSSLQNVYVFVIFNTKCKVFLTHSINNPLKLAPSFYALVGGSWVVSSQNVVSMWSQGSGANGVLWANKAFMAVVVHAYFLHLNMNAKKFSFYHFCAPKKGKKFLDGWNWPHWFKRFELQTKKENSLN